MRIRTKLVILLVSVALAPLAIQGINDRMSVRALGKRIADRSAEELTNRAAGELRRAARASAQMLTARARIVETVVRAQAETMEGLLNERRITGFPPAPPSSIGMPWTNTEIDAALESGGPLPEGMGADPNYYRLRVQGEPEPVLVSWTQPVLVPAPGLSDAVIGADAPLLAAWAGQMLPYHGQYADLILSYFACSTDGVHIALPGKGGYPDSYDGRKRPWFGVAEDLGPGVFAWELLIDAPTRQLRATCATVVQDESGQTAAVVAVDVSIFAMLDLVALPQSAERNTNAAIIATRTRPGQYTRGDILASLDPEDMTGVSWAALPERRRLAEDLSADDVNRLFDALGAEGGGSFEMVHKGERSLVACYGVGEGDEIALLVVEPLAGITARAEEAREQVRSTAMNLIRESAVVGFLALGVTALLAVFVAKRVSGPVTELCFAAGSIAEGDLDTHVETRGDDEIAELGRAFNKMAPKLKDRLRMREALEVAQKVQQNLLPHEPPVIEGFDLAGLSVYCDETGGDYFDYIPATTPGSKLMGIAVGDVTGHGIGAALLMTTARASLRHAAMDHESIDTILGGVNRVLEADTGEGRFMTLLYMRLDPTAKTLTWVSAGHDPAIRFDPSKKNNEDGGFDELDSAGGVPLGIVAEFDYPAPGSARIESSQVIVTGTDGIWEARSISGEMFGKERMKEIVAANADQPAAEIARLIVEAVHEHHAGVPQQDDITVVVIRVA